MAPIDAPPSLEAPAAQSRVDAARVLAERERGDPEALAAVVGRLARETDRKVLASLLIALGRLGDASHVEQLAAHASHADPRVRANLVEALLHLGSPRGLPLIIPFLGDAHPRVRANAALALNRLGSRKVVDTLSRMVRSPKRWMRASALHALAMLEPDHARPLLDSLCDDPDPGLREHARRIRERQPAAAPDGDGRIGDPRGAPAGKLQEPPPGGSPREAPGEVPGGSAPAPAGETAAAAPSASGLDRVERAIHDRDLEGLGRLIQELGPEEDRFVRSRLMSAIGLLGEGSLAGILVDHLEDPDPRVVSNAIRSLAQLDHRPAADRVRLFLESLNPRLRTEAIRYFASHPGVDLAGPLAQLIAARDRQARIAGILCLAGLPRPDLLEVLDHRPPDPSGQLAELIRQRLDEVPDDGRGQRRAVLEALGRAPAGPAVAPVGVAPPRSGTGTGESGTGTGPAAAGGAPPPMTFDPLVTAGVPGGLRSARIQVSARKWRSLLIASRITATLTDLAAIVFPLALIHGLLDRLGGGAPPALAGTLAAIALVLFLMRDLPQGPGIGKRIMGLEIEPWGGAGPAGGPLARVLRQIPILVAPWGQAELWLAGHAPDGQRWTDRRLGLRVVVRGYPQLDRLAASWLAFAGMVLCGILVRSGGPRPDPLAGLPVMAGAAGDAGDTGSPDGAGPGPAPPPDRDPGDHGASGEEPVLGARTGRPGGPGGPPGREGHHAHRGLGLALVLPPGWAVEALGSRWIRIGSTGPTAPVTGFAHLSAPDDPAAYPEPGAWAAAVSREFRRILTREDRELRSWREDARPSPLGRYRGPVHSGRTMRGDAVIVTAIDGPSGPLGLALCTPAITPGRDRRLLEFLLDGCRDLPPGGAGPLRSHFFGWPVVLPAGWELEREDRAGVVIRPVAEPRAGFIRLRTSPLPGAPGGAPAADEAIRRWVEAHRPDDWTYQGFRETRTRTGSLDGSPDVEVRVWDLRGPGGDVARLRVAWVPHPGGPLWIEEWLVNSLITYAGSLERVVQGLHPAGPRSGEP